MDAAGQGGNADSTYATFLLKPREMATPSISTFQLKNGCDAHAEFDSRQQSGATRHSTCEPVSAAEQRPVGGCAGGALTVASESPSYQEVEKSLHALTEGERENLAAIAALEHRRTALAKAAERIQDVIEQSRESGQTEVMRAAEYQLQSIYQKQQESQALDQLPEQNRDAGGRAQLSIASDNRQDETQVGRELPRKSVSGTLSVKQQTDVYQGSQKIVVSVAGSPRARDGKFAAEGIAKKTETLQQSNKAVLTAPRYETDKRLASQSPSSPRGFSHDSHDMKHALAQESRSAAQRSSTRWKQQVVNLLRLPGPNLTREQFLSAFYHPGTSMSESLLMTVFDQLKNQSRDVTGAATEHVSIPVVLDVLEKHNGGDIVRLIEAAELLEMNIRNVDKKCKNLAKSPLHEFTRRCTCRFLLNLAKKAYAEMETTSQRFAPAVAVAGYSHALEGFQYALTKSLAAEKNLTLEQANVVVSKCIHNMRNELETDLIQLRRMEIQAQAEAEEAKAAAAARARLQKVTPQEAEALGIPYSALLQVAGSPEGVPVSGGTSRSVSVPGPAGQVAVTYRYPDGTLVTDPAHLPEGARAAELAAQMEIQKTASLAAEAARRAEEIAVAQAASAAQAAVSAATFGGALLPPSLTSILPNAAPGGSAPSGDAKDANADKTGSRMGAPVETPALRGMSTPGNPSTGMHLLPPPQQSGSYSTHLQSCLVSSEADARRSVSPASRRSFTGTMSGMLPGMEGMRPQSSPFPLGYPSQESRMQSAHMFAGGQQMANMFAQEEAMKGFREGVGASLTVPSAVSTPKGQLLSQLPPNGVPGGPPSAGSLPLRPGLQTLSMTENRDMFRRTKAPAGNQNVGGAPAASTRSMSLVDPLRQAGKLLAGALGLWKEEKGAGNEESGTEEDKHQMPPEEQTTTQAQQNGAFEQMRQNELMKTRALDAPQHLSLPEMPQGLPVPAGAGYAGSPLAVPSAPGPNTAGMAATYYSSTLPSTSTGVCPPRQLPSQMHAPDSRGHSGAYHGETLRHEGFQSAPAPAGNSYSMASVYQRPSASAVAAVLGRKQADSGDGAMPTCAGVMESSTGHSGAAVTQTSPLFGHAQAAPSASLSSVASTAGEDSKECRIRVSSYQEVPRPQLGKQEVGNLQQVQAQLEQLSLAHLEEYAKKFGLYSTPEEAAAALGGVPLQGVGALAAGTPATAPTGSAATMGAAFWGGVKTDGSHFMPKMGGLGDTLPYQMGHRGESGGVAGQRMVSAVREGEPMSQAQQRVVMVRQQYPGHGHN
ncbi:conserved hypothetical protein [Neospora caninum Liverpool]|uniref:Uncharacterized protein n=1 Tax=Neospora caninum (strain Liverpool) TaxID=572307 RepID=F0VE65_NEOCL|nr:conserved hypothetical protein [Neospora caninum Liverpool]CBZ52009.1 conserved hypothetical protein [Neospora caninum Liverpool]CEL65970.1 TPA: hypothetical protein BN1204_017990 [Neospora caninum Liverpool]|eukprot:XP_003882041.1 conserved hypothetical protein [Neospora caninum Liverpool]